LEIIRNPGDRAEVVGIWLIFEGFGSFCGLWMLLRGEGGGFGVRSWRSGLMD